MTILETLDALEADLPLDFAFAEFSPFYFGSQDGRINSFYIHDYDGKSSRIETVFLINRLTMGWGVPIELNRPGKDYLPYEDLKTSVWTALHSLQDHRQKCLEYSGKKWEPSFHPWGQKTLPERFKRARILETSDARTRSRSRASA
jgi:hypothetical protein